MMILDPARFLLEVEGPTPGVRASSIFLNDFKLPSLTRGFGVVSV